MSVVITAFNFNMRQGHMRLYVAWGLSFATTRKPPSAGEPGLGVCWGERGGGEPSQRSLECIHAGQEEASNIRT